MDSKFNVARWVIVLASGILFILVAAPRLWACVEGFNQFYSLELFNQVGSKKLEGVPSNELSKEAGELFLSQSDKMFTLAGVLFAALFALVAAKKDEGKLLIRDVQEVIGMVLAAMAIFGSAAYHVLLVRRFSLWLQVQSEQALLYRPKISVEEVSGHFLQQSTMLLVGICIAVATLFSANLLRKNT